MSNCLFFSAEAASEQSARNVKIKMNRVELRQLWNRSKTDPRFRRLLHRLLAALVTVPSKPRAQFATCELARFILTKAGASGRRDLKRRLAEAGW